MRKNRGRLIRECGTKQRNYMQITAKTFKRLYNITVTISYMYTIPGASGKIPRIEANKQHCAK